VKRKICVVSGCRADYGLLRWTMQKIRDDSDLNLQIVVTGSHLSTEYGLTYKEIEGDGFIIDEKVDILLDTDSAQDIAKSMGLGLISFSDILKRLAPDLLLLLGDRYEIFSVAAVATALHIPIAHCHGGEQTEGAIDEAMRHSITKMAHLHFTTTDEYRRRVIQLGEHPERVFNVGAFGLEGINRTEELSRSTLEQRLGQSLEGRTLLVTYHPETHSLGASRETLNAILEVLDDFADAKLIFTLSNADEGGRLINKIIRDYVTQNPNRSVVHANLGQQALFSLMRHIDGVVGNSSSGIIEAPSFNIGTVNIGDRQKGRVRGASIIDCRATQSDVGRALRTLLSEEFRREVANMVSPYKGGDVSGLVNQILKTTQLRTLVKKRFFDLNVMEGING
jgi:GDP/UDP-N,N'-diacetylbacillosamine 2-epimerase (hydrolysing)